MQQICLIAANLSHSNHITVPETPVGLVDYESDASDDSEDDSGDEGNDGSGENDEQQWIDQDIRIDARTSGNVCRHPVVFTLPNVGSATPLEFFKHFLPMEYIQQHVIHAINCYAAALGMQYWQWLKKHEFMLWIGLWTVMTIAPLPNRNKYWESKPTYLYSKPTTFRQWMSQRRFDTILQASTLEHLM